ncbi:addiction module antidote protein [Rhizobium sp. C1]|uniref:addiction module antidote protein n=1 Tax=Rhizobium sp. C1 TaxID=1349799 RepID=UPI001E3EF7F8|nr:addiction module antidote protein [Rhizobium sp. C1]MCD2176593.1 putative addiction module antidote protein [Rhizobium sp. C1]
MAVETKLFDASEYMESEEAQAEYISIVMEDGDLEEIKHALGIVARARGMTAIAREAGVTREALYKALSDKGDPKFSTLLGVVKALGLKFELKKIEAAE